LAKEKEGYEFEINRINDAIDKFDKES